MPPGTSPGPIGTSHRAPIDDGTLIRTDSPVPGPVGLNAGDRNITVVIKDWVPPAPRTTPEIVVGGATLADVFDELNRLPEWGQAGGMLRTDRVPVGTSPTVTVHVHANLVFRLPRWTGYAHASAAAKAEWDQMFAKLRAHEQRHLDNAIEEADNLAAALNGEEIGRIAQLVTDANRTLHQRQVQLDADTDHGAKSGVPFGDVILDTSIP